MYAGGHRVRAVALDFCLCGAENWAMAWVDIIDYERGSGLISVSDTKPLIVSDVDLLAAIAKYSTLGGELTIFGQFVLCCLQDELERRQL